MPLYSGVASRRVRSSQILPRCCGVIPQEPSSCITIWSEDIRIQQVRQTAARESEKASEKAEGP